MTKHFYFHSSNLDYINEVQQDELFEHISLYNDIDFHNIHQNEFGRIKTKDNYIHLLFGNISNDNCPWCGSEAILEIEDDPRNVLCNSGTIKKTYYLQCRNCFSTGPHKTFAINGINNLEVEDHIIELVKSNYSYRKSWDYDLKKIDMSNLSYIGNTICPI